LVRVLPGPFDLRDFVLRVAPPELSRHWRSRRYEGRAGWLHWSRREAPEGRREVAYKVYVNPRPENVKDAVGELVPVLTESGCERFKVGATPGYLARPDKLVAYFPERAEALQVAEQVGARLQGVPSHPVPFTCWLDPAGLVSWGKDPPSSDEQPMSWRSWLCGQIAEAMTGSSPFTRVAAALGRVRRLGIDPASWAPPLGLWEAR
jgi:hypothetical protein